MDIDGNLLMASLLFGTVGMGMLMFGKKSGRMVPIAAGLALVVVPYFLSNLIALLLVGGALSAAPWIVRES